MSLKPYKRVGLVAKPKEEVITHLHTAAKWLQDHDIDIIAEQVAASYLGYSEFTDRNELAYRCDFILLFGGDGTFLSVAAAAVLAGVPIAGVNLGNMGFLTELKKESLLNNLEEIFCGGNTPISLRSVLRIFGCVPDSIALNDLVVNKGNISRIIQLQLNIDGQRVAQVDGDGIIVATPTGSTAYSLSAGGPIVSPQVKGIVVTPICPHSLTFRPLVITDQSIIDITLISEIKDVYLTIDGQQVFRMAPGACCRIETHPKPLHIVSSQNLSYFNILREKLYWGNK